MLKGVWSLPFDDSAEYVTRRALTAGDVSLSPGDTVPESVFSPRRLRQLFDQRRIVHRATWEALMEGFTHFPAVEESEPVAELPTEPVPAPVVTESPANVPGLPGLPGAETPTVDAELEKLRADAKELGIEVDAEWKADRLQSEIDKVLNKS